MRFSTAVALAVLGALTLVGCKSGGSSSGPKKPRKTPRSTTVVAPTPGVAPVDVSKQTKDFREGRAKDACKSLSDARRERVEEVIAVMLYDTMLKNRIDAINKLAELADSRATPFLMNQVTQQADMNVKLAAISALGYIADPTSAPLLIDLLEDEDLNVAQEALDALTVMCGKDDEPFAFVNGTTVKIRKKDAETWRQRLKEGFFKSK